MSAKRWGVGKQSAFSRLRVNGNEQQKNVGIRGTGDVPCEFVTSLPKNFFGRQRGDEEIGLQGAHCAGIEIDYEVYYTEDHTETSTGFHVQPVDPTGTGVTGVS